MVKPDRNRTGKSGPMKVGMASSRTATKSTNCHIEKSEKEKKGVNMRKRVAGEDLKIVEKATKPVEPLPNKRAKKKLNTETDKAAVKVRTRSTSRSVVDHRSEERNNDEVLNNSVSSQDSQLPDEAHLEKSTTV